jgi:hypothetical protein
MADSASRLIAAVLATALRAGDAIAAEVRDQLLALAGRAQPLPDFLHRARGVMDRHEPLLERTLTDALLAAWLGGARRAAEPLPEVTFAAGELPELPPFAAGLPEPVVRFPSIEAAAKDLAAREVMTRADFDTLDAQARRAAFTVARVTDEDALEKVRVALADAAAAGGTPESFRGRVAEALGETALDPGHLETVFRTNLATAHAAGFDEVLNHPLVADEFPYVEYHAVHDGRARAEHLAMERLGIQGTNIYRRDDPIWDRFTPPWSFNCRCDRIALTLEDAARKGVREAKAWLESGVPPAEPAWVSPPPFDPPAGWATRPRLAAVI